jgi:hypothetical protein
VDGPIEATRIVSAPPEEVFGFLSTLENHWRLADRWIEVVSPEGSPSAGPEAAADRGTVRLRGPLGVKRTADTRVLAVRPVSSLVGRADVGRRTCARVSWALEARGAMTHVTLAAAIERAGPLDRALLALGGRAWIERRFRSVLERLAERFAQQAVDGGGRLGESRRSEVSERWAV